MYYVIQNQSKYNLCSTSYASFRGTKKILYNNEAIFIKIIKVNIDYEK